MKKTHLLIIVILAVAAIVTGCTKTDDPVTEAVKQGEATLAHIMDFKSQMEAAKANPNAKSIGYMSIDDAVWNVEALFNLTYAYPGCSYGTTVTCDTVLNLTVCANDSVSISDLSTFYECMFKAVQDIYQRIELDDKQFLVLDVEAGERNGSLQAIVLHVVQGSVTSSLPPIPDPPQLWTGPFLNGFTWYYGENGGTSNGLFNGIMDAADTLTLTLNAHLVPQPPENYEYMYIHIIHKTSSTPTDHPFLHSWFPNISSQYCEFYRTNPSPDDFWLGPDLMNFHFYGECHLVQEVFRSDNTPVPSSHSLFLVQVGDYEIGNIIGHHTDAYYGERFLVAQGVIVREDL